jgi:hypothetical protein
VGGFATDSSTTPGTRFAGDGGNAAHSAAATGGDRRRRTARQTRHRSAFWRRLPLSPWRVGGPPSSSGLLVSSRRCNGRQSRRRRRSAETPNLAAVECPPRMTCARLPRSADPAAGKRQPAEGGLRWLGRLPGPAQHVQPPRRACVGCPPACFTTCTSWPAAPFGDKPPSATPQPCPSSCLHEPPVPGQTARPPAWTSYTHDHAKSPNTARRDEPHGLASSHACRSQPICLSTVQTHGDWRAHHVHRRPSRRQANSTTSFGIGPSCECGVYIVHCQVQTGPSIQSPTSNIQSPISTLQLCTCPFTACGKTPVHTMPKFGFALSSTSRPCFGVIAPTVLRLSYDQTSNAPPTRKHKPTLRPSQVHASSLNSIDPSQTLLIISKAERGGGGGGGVMLQLLCRHREGRVRGDRALQRRRLKPPFPPSPRTVQHLPAAALLLLPPAILA